MTQRREEIRANQTYLIFTYENNAHCLFRSDVRGFRYRVKGVGRPKERKMCQVMGESSQIREYFFYDLTIHAHHKRLFASAQVTTSNGVNELVASFKVTRQGSNYRNLE